MDKEQVKQQASTILGDVAKGLPFWADELYDNEWQELSDLTQRLKSLKEAALRRQKDKLP